VLASSWPAASSAGYGYYDVFRIAKSRQCPETIFDLDKTVAIRLENKPMNLSRVEKGALDKASKIKMLSLTYDAAMRVSLFLLSPTIEHNHYLIPQLIGSIAIISTAIFAVC
jgi:hypothetical protein